MKPASPPASSTASPEDSAALRTQIVRAAIFPSIGVARVGNSNEEGEVGYYFAPEVPDPLPEKPGFYKDSAGALKRQAVKFRVYGLDSHGKVVAELTAQNAAINWSVHVANKKAAWYQFQMALDIPEAATAPPSYRRNAEFQGADRAQLAIDPGPRSIHGVNVKGSDYCFDSGSCVGKKVYLGELQTDAQGRLIFLGGKGVSASFDGAIATDFANSDGWYDDTSDGPVTASVTVGGQEIPCDPAWVVTAPPNYAPELKTVRTLHDLLEQVMTDNLMFNKPPADRKVSFFVEVLPILQRLCGLQWVNRGFATQFGAGGVFDFTEEQWIAKLSALPVNREGNHRGEAKDDIHAELRQQIYNYFRQPMRDLGSPVPWPWIYGDAMDVPGIASSPNQNTSLTKLQMQILEKWALGHFSNEPAPNPPRSLDQVPLLLQPACLNQASLEFCLADAFHPGCEVTWPIRQGGLYMGPYRIRHRQPAQMEPDYGDVLTPAIALAPGGPLQAQGPGDLTRWMAVPWQTDTASCRSGYDKTYDPYVPTFWAARVPNQVLTSHDYDIIVNPASTAEERQLAFSRRANWLRLLGLKTPYLDQVNRMVTEFGKLGVIERRTDHQASPGLPEVMLVESPLHEAHAEKRVRLRGAAVALEPDAVDSDPDIYDGRAHHFPVEAQRPQHLTLPQK